MPTPIDRLERAHDEVVAAHGRDFFRQLRAYEALLREDRIIRRHVKRLRKEAKKTERRFEKADEGFTRELVTFRAQFVGRVPEADDGGLPRPSRGGSAAPAASLEGQEWAYTLANFDAVLNDAESQIFVRRDFDHGKSGMLAAILKAKIFNLRFPEQEPAAGVMTRVEVDQRPDLDDLATAVEEIADKEREAYRKARTP